MAGASSSSSSSGGTATTALSTADFVHRLPPAVLRVLVAFAPLISTTHALLLLATWSTPHPHHSLLLVVAYALAVLTAYPLLRYAPQALVLGYIGYAWLARLRPGAASPVSAAGKGAGAREANAAKLNRLVAQLDDIADAAGTLRRQVVVPALALLSWTEDPVRTRRLVIFLLTTYPLYLACYFPWAALGLPTLQLEVLLPWAVLGRAWASAGAQAVQVYRAGAAAAGARLSTLAASGRVPKEVLALPTHPHVLQARALYVAHVHPRGVALVHTAARASQAVVLRYVPSRLSFQVLPPFPLAALSVQSSVLALGVLALTWCAPWAALVRSVLWRSALVRRVVLGVVRLLSGEKGPLAAFGRGHEASLDPTTGEAVFSSSLIRDLVPGDKKTTTKTKEGTVKHEDVVYEFSVYENQRWWMGLDWTSALLPQERPSWADEHHNAVSPPSSFSLPPAKVTTTPAVAEPSGGATTVTKRTVTWKWLDPEWTVAGAGYVGSVGYEPPVPGASGAELAAAARSPLSAGAPSPLSAAAAAGPAAAAAAAAGDADVDEDGWRYGDNLWEKMSGRSGRGRYTRRRRWVRRAVLEIAVERDVRA